MTGAEPVTRRSSSKRNSPRSGPKANVLKPISNAACKPQAKDSGMTDQAIVRRNAKRGESGCFIESIQRMQRAHCEFGESSVNQKRKLYLGGGNSANIDGSLGQSLERLRRDAGMAAHADADHRNLGDIGGAVEPGVTDRTLGFGDHIQRSLVIRG